MNEPLAVGSYKFTPDEITVMDSFANNGELLDHQTYPTQCRACLVAVNVDDLCETGKEIVKRARCLWADVAAY